MNFDGLKNNLQGMQEFLTELERRSRELKNQNLADVAASAKGRIGQLFDHPDLGLVDTDKAEPQPANDTDKPTPEPRAPFMQPGVGLPAQGGPFSQSAAVADASDVQG